MSRAVSLSAELQVVREVVSAATILVAQSQENISGEPGSVEAIRSTLLLVSERLRLLDRVVRGFVDPDLVLCPENTARPPAATDDADILIPIWSAGMALRHHRREARRARLRRKHARKVRTE